MIVIRNEHPSPVSGQATARETQFACRCLGFVSDLWAVKYFWSSLFFFF